MNCCRCTTGDCTKCSCAICENACTSCRSKGCRNPYNTATTAKRVRPDQRNQTIKGQGSSKTPVVVNSAATSVKTSKKVNDGTIPVVVNSAGGSSIQRKGIISSAATNVKTGLKPKKEDGTITGCNPEGVVKEEETDDTAEEADDTEKTALKLQKGTEETGGPFVQKEAITSAVTTPKQEKGGATVERYNPEGAAVKEERDDTEEEVRSKIKPTENLAVTSWNINGKGPAKKRDQVVKATLEQIAGSMDILCIQENTFSYTSEGGKRFSERFPTTVNQMECVEQYEGKVYNFVCYNKDKFDKDKSASAAAAIKKAYDLMDIEQEIIKWIHDGGDDRKKRFNTTTTSSDIFREKYTQDTPITIDDIQMIIKDIYNQIQTYRRKYKHMGNATERTLAFEHCRNHFIRRSGETESKIAQTLLGKRAAMALLKPKGTDTTLLVISYHSYNPSLCPDRLNYLLLDFVEKLYWVNDTITVLICGDFNDDITSIELSKDLMVQKLLEGYTCDEYTQTELRRSVPRIDYILLRKPSESINSLSPVKPREMVSTEDQDVSTDDQKVSTDDKEVSTDDQKVSTDDKEVSTDDEQVSADDQKVSTDDQKVSTDDQKVSTDDPEVSTEDQELSQKRANLDNQKDVTNHSPLVTTLKIQKQAVLKTAANQHFLQKGGGV